MRIPWLLRGQHTHTVLNVALSGIATLTLCCASASAAVTVPGGFESIEISPALNQPVAMAFAPDGRIFVAEKAGVVKVIQGQKTISTFIDLRGEVNAEYDRGMLGIALDPNFLDNRRVYLLYVADPQPGEPDESGLTSTFTRLTRYSGSTTSKGNVADRASRNVLIGATPSDGIPQCFTSHAGGSLRFGNDGSLLVAHGESAVFFGPDPGGMNPTCFQPPLFGSEEDIGAFRAQMIDSMDGKILRIDPKNGNGLPGNPFWAPAKPAAPRSRMWTSGLRNPFRFCVQPGTGGGGHPGTLFIGDVGWAFFEEINVVTRAGENLGWPCREGLSITDTYPLYDLPAWDCASIGTRSNPHPLTRPLITYHHFDFMQSNPPGSTGACVIGGVFHNSNNYPSPFRGGYFFADHISGWINVLHTNANNGAVGIYHFGFSGERPVDFAIDPITQDVCVLLMSSGRIARLHSTISPGDVNHDGVVGVSDLLLVISQWGPCATPLTCPADLDVSGAVNVTDLLEVILYWD